MRVRLSLGAGQLVMALPEFRGRDRVLARIRSEVRRFDGTVQSTYAGGIRVQLNPKRDGSPVVLFLRFSKPALAPVFDGVLSAGDAVADVGASIGLYTLYAARCVGPGGRVHSFEPVPHVRSLLVENLALNGFGQVEIVEEAVGSEAGQVDLFVFPDVSGLGSRTRRPGASERITVPQRSLDEHFRELPTPRLVKIDAEGADLDVLRGAWSLLGREDPPFVVFEAGVDELRPGEYREFRERLLEERGFEVFVLCPSGARPEAPDAETPPRSYNLVAARPDLPGHARAIDALRRARFPRNQGA